jgi:membrane-bound serine protease (ClpP class)
VEAWFMTAVVIALLVTGAALLIAEAHVASYGLLGLAGAVALAGGVGLALDAGGVSLWLILVLAAAMAAGLASLGLVATRAALRMRRRRALGGSQGLIGRVGVVRRELAPVGVVAVMGELWRARPAWSEIESAPLEGEDVIVEQVHGLTLWVRRAEEWEVHP